MHSTIPIADNFSRSILGALSGHRHVYAGTVTRAEKTRRRAANKTARQSRRANRGSK